MQEHNAGAPRSEVVMCAQHEKAPAAGFGDSVFRTSSLTISADAAVTSQNETTSVTDPLNCT
jgi:hypothetical protein